MKLTKYLALFIAGNLSLASVAFADLNSANVNEIVAGNSQFALDLYARLRTGRGNVFFSPYSISSALAMTYAGARLETADQMAATLRFKLSFSRVHLAFAELENHINAIQEEKEVQLAVANSLWPQTGFVLLPDYLALCKQNYGTAIMPVDFAEHTDAARNEINEWVSDRTNAKIPELIKPGMLNGGVRLVLVNAIYFKGDWQIPFNVRLTEDQPFHVSPDTSVKAPLMQQTDEFGYGEFPGVQVLEIPYADWDISMLVLLPRDVDGLTNLEAQLTPENLKSWTTGLPTQRVHVFLPKFTVRSQFLLADTLAAMGMPDAFDGNKADFSGMDGRRDLFISRVIHEAYVQVDEKGTEAAAATGVAMLGRAASPRQVPVFRADHPFLFLIRDNQTGSILFLGRMADPTR
ncbi:MAG TPA: serpin family protein [Alphaproteobacteria bacterium]|nr:serpin family protein [Alphaproteobacteria bacterium]